MRRAQQCRYFASSLPPSNRHSRLTIVRRGCWMCRIAGIHGEAMYTALTLRSACSSSRSRLPMCGVEGQSPSRSLGGQRGPFSHVREWPPYCALPHAAGEPKTQPLQAAPPSAPAGCPKPRSRAYVASAEPRSALKSGRNALHSHPSFQRRRTPSPSFTSKVKTTASSVCALTR